MPGYGLKTPPTRLVLPPWLPTWPLTQRALWSGAWLKPSATGYELAGPRIGLEQRGAALDRLKNVAVEIIGLSQRQAGPPAGARGAARPRDGGAWRQTARQGSRRPAPTSWRPSFSEREEPVNDHEGFAAALRAVVDRSSRSELSHPRDRRLGSSRRPALRPRFFSSGSQFPP